MRLLDAVVSSLALALSAALSAALVRAAVGPGAQHPGTPQPPPALLRPPSAQERATVLGLVDRMQGELTHSRAVMGRTPTTAELESQRPDGQPVLAHGLGDNPLRPGVAGVQARCPPVEEANDQIDWIYCEETGEIIAVGLSSYQLSGSE